jgi:hypothetical protein
MRHPLPHLLLSMAILISALSPLAHAEMRVIDSNTEQYKIDAVLQDDHKFDDLGRGCFVRVLSLSSKETLLFEGPPKSPKLPMGGTRRILREPPPC